LKTNQIKAGIVLSYISLGLGTIISLLYTPIMIRLLGQSEYGLYNLVASVVSYLSLLSFGFGSAYIRFYSRYKVKNDQEAIKKLNGLYMLVFAIIGLICLIAGLILAQYSTVIFGNKLSLEELAKAKILMIILVINISLTFPFSVFNSYITANEKFIFLKSLQIIKSIANPFIVLPILLLGYKSVGLVVGITSLNIAIQLITAVFCMFNLKIKFNFK